VAKQREETTVTVMVEIPKGSRNKYEYDEQRKMLRFNRMLFSRRSLSQRLWLYIGHLSRGW